MQDTRHNNHFLANELGLKCSLTSAVNGSDKSKPSTGLDSKKLANLTNHTDSISNSTSNGTTNTDSGSSMSQMAKYKINPAQTPILTEILKSNDILPYVLQFNSVEKSKSKNSRVRPQQVPLFREANNVFTHKEQPSHDIGDYFEVAPEHTKQMEKLAPDNSLFLAVARSLLCKVYFFDRKYEYVLRNVCLDDALLRDKFKFDSDLSLQEILRKKLCTYWLENVVDGKFFGDKCKYSKYDDYLLAIHNGPDWIKKIDLKPRNNSYTKNTHIFAFKYGYQLPINSSHQFIYKTIFDDLPSVYDNSPLNFSTWGKTKK